MWDNQRGERERENMGRGCWIERRKKELETNEWVH